VSYALDNAFFQWQEGERRLRDTEPRVRAILDSAAELVIEELRRRLGSRFSVQELAELYGAGSDWAWDLAASRVVSGEASAAVDAAFGRYAREASDDAGGRARLRRS
jgi:hypothetical protein